MKVVKNPDEKIYEKVTKAVIANSGYCPCLIQKNDDTKCMCREFIERPTVGACRCGRFVKTEV